jgi:hypothetical protein
MAHRSADPTSGHRRALVERPAVLSSAMARRPPSRT